MAARYLLNFCAFVAITLFLCAVSNGLSIPSSRVIVTGEKYSKKHIDLSKEVEALYPVVQREQYFLPICSGSLLDGRSRSSSSVLTASCPWRAYSLHHFGLIVIEPTGKAVQVRLRYVDQGAIDFEGWSEDEKISAAMSARPDKAKRATFCS